jgi:hypothetical protein
VNQIFEINPLIIHYSIKKERSQIAFSELRIEKEYGKRNYENVCLGKMKHVSVALSQTQKKE